MNERDTWEGDSGQARRGETGREGKWLGYKQKVRHSGESTRWKRRCEGQKMEKEMEGDVNVGCGYEVDA